MAKLVSKTYGDALFELAVEDNQIDSFLEEVKGILQVLEENEDLGRFMNHPKILKEEKIKVIENIFNGQVSRELVGLITMIVSKDRYGSVMEILTYFVDRVKAYKHIGTAYVTTAMELSGEQQEQVKKRLLDTTDYVELEMNYSTDQSLIGGMVIRIGDRVVDSSIRTKIYRLSRELSRVQVV